MAEVYIENPSTTLYSDQVIEAIPKGYFAETIAQLQQKLRLDSEDEESHYQLRNVINKKKEFDYYTKMYEHGNLDPELYQGIYHFYEKDYADAEKCLEDVLIYRPESGLALNFLGKVKAQMNKLDEALDCFEKAFQIDPIYDGSLIDKAHIYTLKNNCKKAAEEDKRQIISRVKNKRYPHIPVPADIKSLSLKNENETGVPIVIFQRSFNIQNCNRDYVYYCLAQAKRSNPNSPVYLITDSLYDCDFIHQFNILDYYKSADQFGDLYQHVTKDVLFSFFAITYQRWFILNEFMEKHQIDQCVHIDPDVLLYQDVNKEIAERPPFDLLLSDHEDFGTCGHFCYVGNRQTLQEFCDYMLFLFTKPTSIEACTNLQKRIWFEQTGYLSDIQAFEEFTQKDKYTVVDLSRIENGVYYDENIASSNGFEMNYGFKQITWQDGIPYGQLKETGELIKLQGLHFNSGAKIMMQQAFNEQPFFDALPREIKNIYQSS